MRVDTSLMTARIGGLAESLERARERGALKIPRDLPQDSLALASWWAREMQPGPHPREFRKRQNRSGEIEIFDAQLCVQRTALLKFLGLPKGRRDWIGKARECGAFYRGEREQVFDMVVASLSKYRERGHVGGA